MCQPWFVEGFRGIVRLFCLLSTIPARTDCPTLSIHVYRTTDRATDLSAQIFLTFTVTKTGAVRLSAQPTFFTPERVQCDVEITDEEVKAILARPLKAKVAKKPKAAKVDGEAGEEAAVEA